MRAKIFLSALMLSLIIQGKAQTDLSIDKNIRLPKDSIERSQLMMNLNDFLLAAQKSDKENKWTLQSEKAETQILLEKIHGIENEDSIKFSPYLMNVEALADRKSYLIQVGYMGISDKEPMLRACFEFIAHKTDVGFLFSSPLVRRTKDWKTKTVGHFIFHYQDTTAVNGINQLAQYLVKYDEMLSVRKKTEYFFCDDCESMIQMLQLVGMLYEMGYNGFDWNGIFFDTEEQRIILESQRQSRRKIIDPHDTFHERAAIAIPDSIRNHYMVCGCAYIYGGSWGISWEDIQKKFKEKLGNNMKSDWLKLYFERYNFGDSQEEHLLVTQFINAIIMQKVEKEQGFQAVIKLLSSGNMYKDKTIFFKILESVTGINEKNFNKEVGKLIDDAMKTLK